MARIIDGTDIIIIILDNLKGAVFVKKMTSKALYLYTRYFLAFRFLLGAHYPLHDVTLLREYGTGRLRT